MAEVLVGFNRVVGPAPHPGTVQIACAFKVFEYMKGRPRRDTNTISDLRNPDAGVGSDCEQDVPMVRQKGPAALSASGPGRTQCFVVIHGGTERIPTHSCPSLVGRKLVSEPSCRPAESCSFLVGAA